MSNQNEADLSALDAILNSDMEAELTPEEVAQLMDTTPVGGAVGGDAPAEPGEITGADAQVPRDKLARIIATACKAVMARKSKADHDRMLRVVQHFRRDSQVISTGAELGSAMQEAAGKPIFRLNQPDTFDGKDPKKVQPWLRAMQTYLIAARTPETCWVDVATTYLGTVALSYWQTFALRAEARGADLRSWALFRDAIVNGFGHIDDERLARVAFDNVYQGRQTAAQYAMRFRALLSRIVMNPVDDMEAIRRFRKGLNPDLAARTLFDPKTGEFWTDLDACIKCVVAVEREMHLVHHPNSQTSHGRKRNREYDEGMSPMSYVAAVQGRDEGGPGPNTHRFRSQNGKAKDKDTQHCLACGEKGHWREDCPKLPNDVKDKLRAAKKAKQQQQHGNGKKGRS